METKSVRQRKTLSRKESVASPSTTPEAAFDDAVTVAAESDKGATLEIKITSSNQPATNPQLGLSICPQCGQRSLFWNRHDQIYRCVNPECKKSFTFEEYQNKEAAMLLDKLQTDQALASVLITEAIDKQEPAVAGETPSNESTTAAICETQPATEQKPSNESMTAVNQIPGAVEHVPCPEPIIAAKGEIEAGAVEQKLSNVWGAEAKYELERGKIEQAPYSVPTTGVENEIEVGAKSEKTINRNLAFLIIGVLVAGILILGVFFGLKSGKINGLSSQLTESKEALTASQEQLAISQKDITELSSQLTQAQQEIEALQAQVNELKPLTPGEPIVYSGELSGGETISIPMELNQSERVEGTITAGLGGLAVYIYNPTGGIAENFGQVFRYNFIFTATESGTYTMIITGSAGIKTSYTVNFTIYHMQ